MDNPQEFQKRFQEVVNKEFGSREAFLAWQIVMLSMSGQPCDLTFYKRKPMLDVKIDQRLVLAMMYGAGPEKIAELLNDLRLTNGQTVAIREIWTVHPMPHNGFKKGELESVDIKCGEEKYGPNGETLRQMIRDTYHCEAKEEEDNYLRRYIAS